MRELVLRSAGRSTADVLHRRPPVREIAGLRLDPFRREVFPRRPLRRPHAQAVRRARGSGGGAEGGVVSAEELLERAWDENADPFTNAVRITVSALRKRLGEPWAHRDRARRRLPHRTRGTGGGRDGAGEGVPGMSARLKLTLSYAGPPSCVAGGAAARRRLGLPVALRARGGDARRPGPGLLTPNRGGPRARVRAAGGVGDAGPARPRRSRGVGKYWQDACSRR